MGCITLAGSQNGECRNDGGEPRFSKQDPLIRVYFVLRNDAALLSFSRALESFQDFLFELDMKPCKYASSWQKLGAF